MRVFKLLVVFLFSAGVAMADDQTLDVTIKVVESPTDRPGAVTKNIQLPPAAVQKVRENAPAGEPGSANMSRESADMRQERSIQKERSVQKERQSMKKAARESPKKAARDDMAAGKAKQKGRAKKKQQ